MWHFKGLSRTEPEFLEDRHFLQEEIIKFLFFTESQNRGGGVNPEQRVLLHSFIVYLILLYFVKQSNKSS